MEEKLIAQIRSAVGEWARQAYSSDDIVVGQAAADDIEDEEATRYLVDFAVRALGYWSVAEVWIADGNILSVNDLGEGVPLDNPDWPWPVQKMGA